MGRISKTFNRLKKQKEKALISFTVIGDPDYKTSLDIVKSMAEHSDLLELGLPFSDPIADGPTIQAADIRSLKAGINTDKAFSFVKDVRKFTDKPIGLLVYSNLIIQRGIDKFYRDAASAGVDSVLAADIPVEEAGPFIKAGRKSKVDTVFFATPLTSVKRLKQTATKVRGFIYVVARLGVTGAKSQVHSDTISLLKRIRPHTKLPLAVGFGVSTPKHVKEIASAGADAIIVGSAIVKIIEKNKNKKVMLQKISTFVKSLKGATKD
ncbi:tryptophan synthase subunit alpha [Nanoarchaeota archaeon]